MTLADRFQALRGRHVTDEDGEDYELSLLPPMSDADIGALEKLLPCPIPADIRAVLKITRGFENGPLDTFDVGGALEGGFGIEEIFPHALPIAHDGFGNYWVVDLLPESTTWGPIYFACHDAPVIHYQCANLSEFLDGLLEMMQPPYKGSLDFVHGDANRTVWSTEPGTIEHAAALTAADAEVRAFAQTLAGGWLIVDLRTPKTGDGFAYGRAKLPEDIKRWKTLPMWAYLPKKSLFQRLFGKK